MYPTNDTKREDNMTHDHIRFGYKTLEASPISPQARLSSTPPLRSTRRPMHNQGQGSGSERHSWAPENLNLHVVLEHQYSQQSSDPRRYSYSPSNNLEPSRYPSIRRRKSRAGLKEYGAKQALQDEDSATLSEKRSNGLVSGV